MSEAQCTRGLTRRVTRSPVIPGDSQFICKSWASETSGSERVLHSTMPARFPLSTALGRQDALVYASRIAKRSPDSDAK